MYMEIVNTVIKNLVCYGILRGYAFSQFEYISTCLKVSGLCFC